ncbi:MAG: hypothetical protein ACJ762_11855 [Solirubrobacteraceae bacterium]
MVRTPTLLALLVVLLAPAAAQAADPCPRTRSLHTGPRADGFWNTTAPFEHFGANRSQVFAHSCTLTELTGRAQPRIALRSSPVDFSTPYNAATRNRDQLYLYGYGPDAARQGGYVAGVDPRTLAQRWRTQIPDTKPAGQWSYPGVMLSHANGFLYAIYGNVLVKLDPVSGAVVARRELPEDPQQTGAAYNGMIVLPDGRLAAKKIERGPCASDGPLTGLSCAVANALPSLIVVVDPRRLKVLSGVVPPEPITGRITFGGGHIYAAGRDHLFRYRYARGALTFDRGWGPVAYRTGTQTPGTGPGLLGHFVVVQTNFLPSSQPMTVTAVDSRDSDRVFTIQPFAGSGTGSWIVSKAALDAANNTVVTHDTTAGRMAALRLDPQTGFTVRWSRPLHSLDFSALTGGARHRQIVIADLTGDADQVVWLDEDTGTERARTATLATTPAPGNIVLPGFGGRFYYASSAGRLWELRPVP